MKKRIFSLLLAICLVIPCAILMTACGTGSKKAFSVAGKTLVLTGNIKIVWKENVTEEEKKKYIEEYDEKDITTEQNVIDYLKKECQEANYSFKFDKAGAVVFTYSYDVGKTREEIYYYSQSEDLTEIKLYKKNNYTADTEYALIIKFSDNHFQWINGEDWNNEGVAAQCYFELKKK